MKMCDGDESSKNCAQLAMLAAVNSPDAAEAVLILRTLTGHLH